MIDGDGAFGEEFFEIAGEETEVQEPAHCERDHFWREPDPANADYSITHCGTRRRRLIPPASPTSRRPTTQQALCDQQP